jgi:hypothetical protein
MDGSLGARVDTSAAGCTKMGIIAFFKRKLLGFRGRTPGAVQRTSFEKNNRS